MFSSQGKWITVQYSEIDMDILKVQLPMFLSKHSLKSTGVAADILKAMSREVRGLFNEVEKLVRVLMVVPVSAEDERRFSALKRLKTWLRSTMSQQRLNRSVPTKAKTKRTWEMSDQIAVH